MSRIARVVPAFCPEGGHMYRVIGTVDVVGAGTTHSVADVNPFILFDDPNVFAKKGVPPFGLHPHHGLQVSTLLWSGVMGSRLGSEKEEEKTIVGDISAPNTPGAIVAFAGRGLSHEESTHTADPAELQQLIWLIPDASRTKPAFFEVLKDASWKNVGAGANVIVVVGKAFGYDANMKTDTPVNVVMATLEPKASLEFDTIEGGCFVYIKTGQATINGEQVVKERELAIMNSGTDKIAVQNTSDSLLKVVFGNGSRIEEPWVKLLTQNGFLIARDLEEARRQEEISKKVGLDKYGQ